MNKTFPYESIRFGIEYCTKGYRGKGIVWYDLYPLPSNKVLYLDDREDAIRQLRHVRKNCKDKKFRLIKYIERKELVEA